MNQPSIKEVDDVVICVENVGIWIVLKNTGEMKVMSMSSYRKFRRRLNIVKCEHEAIAYSF